MIPLALAAGMTVAVDNLDWSKASDDLKFALLKPVMTKVEVKRLFAGKTSARQACGAATNANGKTVEFCGGAYGYTLNGGKEEMTIMFDMHGPVMGERNEAWIKPSPYWTLARFQVTGGVVYKRNKEGLYIAQPKK